MNRRRTHCHHIHAHLNDTERCTGEALEGHQAIIDFCAQNSMTSGEGNAEFERQLAYKTTGWVKERYDMIFGPGVSGR